MNKLFYLSVLLALVLTSGCKTSETAKSDKESAVGVIAHRGYWDIEGSVENSISSLQNAIDGHFYGSEIDVHLTIDDVAVIYHDNKIEKTIPIQESDYTDLENVRLRNGEELPLLEKHLEVISKQNHTKLIIEIKSHSTPERNRDAAQVVYNMVKEYNVEKLCEYISFSMDACKELIKLNKKNKVSFLTGSVKNAPDPATLAKEGFWGIDYKDAVFVEHPEFIKNAHDAGMKVNVWTVNDDAQMQKMVDMGVDFITTDNPDRLKRLLIITSNPVRRNK